MRLLLRTAPAPCARLRRPQGDPRDPGRRRGAPAHRDLPAPPAHARLDEGLPVLARRRRSRGVEAETLQLHRSAAAGLGPSALPRGGAERRRSRARSPSLRAAEAAAGHRSARRAPGRAGVCDGRQPLVRDYRNRLTSPLPREGYPPSLLRQASARDRRVAGITPVDALSNSVVDVVLTAMGSQANHLPAREPAAGALGRALLAGCAAPAMTSPSMAASDERRIDVLDYVIGDAGLWPRRGSHGQNQIVDRGRQEVCWTKYGNPRRFECWRWDDQFVYHAVDHALDGDSEESYTLTDGRWMPRFIGPAASAAAPWTPHVA